MRRPSFIALFAILLLPPLVHAQDTDTSNSEPNNTDIPTEPKIDHSIFDDDEDDAKPDNTDKKPKKIPPTMVPIDTMKPLKPKPDLNTGPPLNQQTFDEMQARIDLMEEDIERLIGEQDKLKQESLLDRLHWSGAYRFNLNVTYLDITYKRKEITHLMMKVDDNMEPIFDEKGRPETKKKSKYPSPRKEWLAPTWTHRLQLALGYEFGKSLRFYSQLGVYKYFNETKNTIGNMDHGSNAYPRDNAFRLERVYLDWYVTKWMAISLGRIASPDGPPTELKENTSRRSGWGVQMMNATIDSIMTTFYLGKSHYLRVFYSPMGNHADYDIGTPISLFDDKGIKLLHSWGGILELAMPGGNKESIFQLGFFHVPKVTPRDPAILFPGADEPVRPVEPDGDDLGNYFSANSLMLMKDLFKSGIDIFAAYTLTLLQPTKDRMVYESPITLPIYHPMGGDTGESVTVTREMKSGLASFEEGAGTTNLGHGVYAGIRYTLPTNEQYPTRIGGEFNWGSKYHTAWSHPNEQLNDKLGNKGWVAEGYIIQQLVPKHLYMRLAYMELQRDFLGKTVGPTHKIDLRVRNINFMIHLAW